MKILRTTLLSILILLYSCEKDSITENKNDSIIDIKTGQVSDIEGNTYQTIKIGNQWWMKENLKTTKYNDGTKIAELRLDSAWANTNEGAYCAYQNDSSLVDTFGLLYNYHAIVTEKLCPDGWHIPTIDEWRTLLNYIDSTLGYSNECDALRSDYGWTDEYTNTPSNGVDLVGFTALPSGYRAFFPENDSASFIKKGTWTYFWSSTQVVNSEYVYTLDLNPYDPSYISNSVYQKVSILKNVGISIRLIKDN